MGRYVLFGLEKTRIRGEIKDLDGVGYLPRPYKFNAAEHSFDLGFWNVQKEVQLSWVYELGTCWVRSGLRAGYELGTSFSRSELRA